MRGSKLISRSIVVSKPQGEDSAEIPDEDVTPELPGHAKGTMVPEPTLAKQYTVSRQQLEEALKKKATNLFNINKEKLELEQETLKN